MARLTKTLIESTSPHATRDTFLWDSDLKGFGARIKPSGVVSFFVDYRNPEGRKRRLTLGRFGVLTCEAARKEALRQLAAATLGGDPQEERQAQRSPTTLGEVFDHYLTHHVRPKRKPATIYNYESQWKNHVAPRLANHPVASIKLKDVAELHGSMASSPAQANRVLALLSALLNYAERLDLRAFGSNPCRQVERFRERRRERFLSGDELKRLGDVLNEASRTESEPPSAILAIRLLALTGMRKGEVLSLRWEDLDMERGFAFLPDSKTGQKSVPLSRAALDLITEAEQEDDNPYVCHGRLGGKGFIGLQKVWERLRAKAKLDGVRLHDLRHTFASHGAAAGLDLFFIGKVLGHKDAATTQRYQHLASHPLREAAERIGSRVSEAMGFD